jgi:hypothetical protein
MNEMWYVLVGSVAAIAGMAWGRWTTEHSLTICPDDDGVCGAHKIGEQFYYLVPESVWVRTPRVWSEDWNRSIEAEQDDALGTSE